MEYLLIPLFFILWFIISGIVGVAFCKIVSKGK
jgi:hypothetical protein